jgi:hypothetical protein
MSKLIKIAPAVAGELGLAALGVAAPVSADSPYCYTDVTGHCTAIRYPRDSPADTAAWGTTPDQGFAYLLTHDDDPAYNLVIMNSAETIYCPWSNPPRPPG